MDPAVRLLERHAAGELDREALVEEISTADPRLGLMARLFAARGAETRDERDDGDRHDAEASLEQARQMTDGARRLALGVRRQFDAVVAEVDALRGRLDALAAALGACPGCWGEDPACRWCRGRGKPGSLPPDHEAFDDLVMPAVRIEADMRRQARRGEQAERVEADERRTA